MVNSQADCRDIQAAHWRMIGFGAPGSVYLGPMRFPGFLLVWSVLALAMASTAFAQAPDPREIVRRADLKMRGESAIVEMSLTVTRRDWSREMRLKSWSQGDDKALVVVLAPPRDKGTAFLRSGREVWNWIPSVERTIKLPPSMMSQNWMGTDFTNEDFVREASVVEDYSHALDGEESLLGRSCWRVVLTPKPDAPVVWGRLVLWIDKAEDLQLKAEFHDEDGVLVNTLLATEVGRLGGRLFPVALEMIPADKPGQKTAMRYLSAQFDVPIPPRTFTLRHLETFR